MKLAELRAHARQHRLARPRSERLPARRRLLGQRILAALQSHIGGPRGELAVGEFLAGRKILVAGLIAIAALQINLSRQHRGVRALQILAPVRPRGDRTGERGDREAAPTRRSKVSH